MIDEEFGQVYVVSLVLLAVCIGKDTELRGAYNGMALLNFSKIFFLLWEIMKRS